MCAPAVVASCEVEVRKASFEQPAAPSPAPRAARLSVLKRIKRWLSGWKQTLMAELAAMGSPKEGFR
jgi:hypothetical protein